MSRRQGLLLQGRTVGSSIVPLLAFKRIIFIVGIRNWGFRDSGLESVCGETLLSELSGSYRA